VAAGAAIFRHIRLLFRRDFPRKKPPKTAADFKLTRHPLRSFLNVSLKKFTNE